MAAKCDTTVQFGSLEPGSYDYRFRLDSDFFADYKNEKIHGGDVLFEVKMDKKSHSLMFHFDFNGTIETECDRCLGAMSVEVNGKETLYVEFADEVTDTQREDMTMLRSDATKIDLAQWMYECVAVALPMQCLHEEGQCDPEVTKYLADDEPTADAQATDARWAALEDLKNEK